MVEGMKKTIIDMKAAIKQRYKGIRRPIGDTDKRMLEQCIASIERIDCIYGLYTNCALTEK
jgi:hypothetical protein